MLRVSVEDKISGVHLAEEFCHYACSIEWGPLDPFCAERGRRFQPGTSRCRPAAVVLATTTSGFHL